MQLKQLWLGALLATGLANAGTATVYYYTPFKNWPTVNMHHNGAGTWTAVPGTAMTAACADWTSATVDFGSASSFMAVFNNGANAWDNNSNANYTITAGINQVKNGVVSTNASSPCSGPDTVAPTIPANLTLGTVTASTIALSWTASTDLVGVSGYEIFRDGVSVGKVITTNFTDSGLTAATSYKYTVLAYDAANNKSALTPELSATTSSTSTNNTVTVFYKPNSSWVNPNIHYKIGSTWTTLPGVAMDSACTGWKKKLIALGSASGLTAAFNNGTTWDSNNNLNYSLGTGNVTVDAGVVGVGDPCGPDTVPPTKPGDPVQGVVSAKSVALSWTASTDAGGLKFYKVIRNNIVIGKPAANSFVDTSVAPSTSYKYKIRAFDLAGNKSPMTNEIIVTTPDLDIVPPTVPEPLPPVINGCSVTISWKPSTDALGEVSYEVFKNGVLVTSVTTTSFTEVLGANTTTTYTIKAVDAAGNKSPASASISVTTGDCGKPPVFRLGVVYTPSKSTFSIWSPDSANVKLSLDGTLHTMSKIADVDGYTNVYSVDVPGNWHLKKYTFQINGVTVRDPYGVMVDASTASATPENIVMDMSQTALTGGWAARPAQIQREDAIIYEVHVRDFTIDASSGVDADKRGKYAGMTQTGTTLNGAGLLKTGIDHLKELGVTHVQILPVYDFGTCSPLMTADVNNPVPDPHPYPSPLCYNWGYDPVNFNVPEERYSANQADAVARVREFKNMVNEFHKNGIRVIMDVVYNHTYNKNVFKDITNKYYTLTDLSGTGNSIDAKNPMVARMIRDSLEFWISEYNIDGFRFDLVGIFDYATVGDWGRYLNQTFPDRNIMIYGEPWNGFAKDTAEADRVRMGTIGMIADAHVGVFNGKYRDALRGDGDKADNDEGFVFNEGHYWGTGQWAGNGAALSPISVGMYGSPRYLNAGGRLADTWDPMFALDPEQSINYVDAHDNYCLNDKVDAWANANGQGGNTAYKDRIQNLALGSVMVSQGIPFMHGGSEMKRTKGGNVNSYRSPDSVNQYNWSWKSSNAAMFTMTQKLIALRKAHPGFRMTSWQQVRDNVKSDQLSKSLVVTTINAAANGDTWNKIVVIQNSGGDSTVSLPAGNWNVVLEDNNPNPPARSVSGSVVAKGTALTILQQ